MSVEFTKDEKSQYPWLENTQRIMGLDYLNEKQKALAVAIAARAPLEIEREMLNSKNRRLHEWFIRRDAKPIADIKAEGTKRGFDGASTAIEQRLIEAGLAPQDAQTVLETIVAGVNKPQIGR